MGLGAILCPDRIGQPAPPSFHPQNRLTGLMVIAHFNLHAEHNWSQTRAPGILRHAFDVGCSMFFSNLVPATFVPGSAAASAARVGALAASMSSHESPP